jgi:ribosomal protein S4
MLAYKTRPRSKIYIALKIIEPNRKLKEIQPKKKKMRFFSPKFVFFFSKSSMKSKERFSNLLLSRKKLRLRYGFHKMGSLKKILNKNLNLKMNSRRILKVLEFCSLLERRLDVILLRLGFVSSLFEAKHLISHKKIYLNGKSISRSARFLKKGDIISLEPSIHFSIRKKINQKLKTHIFHLTEQDSIEVNWKCLKFVLLREKIPFFEQIPFYFFPLNWQNLSNE